MNTDIRISVSFQGHRKRRMLRLKLGDRATDYLLDLWISTASNHPSGVLEGMEPFEIAMEAGYEGPLEPENFVRILVECKLLDPPDVNGNYRIHDWEDHQQYAIHAPARSAKARKAAKASWEKRRGKEHSTVLKDAPGNAQENNEQCSEHPETMLQACSEHCQEHAYSIQKPCSEQCSNACQALPQACNEQTAESSSDDFGTCPDAPSMLTVSISDATSMLGASDKHAQSNAPSPIREKQKAVREELLNKDLLAKRESPAHGSSFGVSEGKAAHDEFLRLRKFWDQKCRQEGYDTGRKEYSLCRANKAWPGLEVISNDVNLRFAMKNWKSREFSPGLAKYLNERWWLSPPAAMPGESPSDSVANANKAAAEKALSRFSHATTSVNV